LHHAVCIMQFASCSLHHAFATKKDTFLTNK
jgi:hypothetical protein